MKTDTKWNGNKFEADPIVNHMCHWGPWADKFSDSADAEKARLAHMLHHACVEINRLCARGQKTSKSQAALLFAYINLVESLPWLKRLLLKSPSHSSSNPLGDIKLLNQWRTDNTMNIKEWDDA